MSVRVGVSHDFLSGTQTTSWGDIGLGRLDEAGVSWRFLDPDDGELTAAHVEGLDAVLFAAPAVTTQTVSGSKPPLLLARFGVGLDAVDLDACSAAGVAVTITPDGARRPVATAALALLLATMHRILAKDRLARTAIWEGRLDLMGRGLTGATIGVIGLGNVATELFHLLSPFGTQHVAYDPYRTPADAAALNVRLTDLDELFSTCDAIVVTASLTDQTRGLVDARLLALMQPHAVLVNISRGAIVDTDALVDVLLQQRILGAGLDVTEPEPLPAGHPLTTIDTVVLAPHAIAWTNEMALGNGTSAVTAILDVLAGRAPRFLANPAALDHPRLSLERIG